MLKLGVIKGPGNIRNFKKCAECIIIQTTNNKLSIRNIVTGKSITYSCSNRISDFCVMSDEFICIGSYAQNGTHSKLLMFSINNGLFVSEIIIPANSRAENIVALSDSIIAALLSPRSAVRHDRIVRFYDWKTCSLITSLVLEGVVRSQFMDKIGSSLLVAGGEGKIVTFQLERFERVEISIKRLIECLVVIGDSDIALLGDARVSIFNVKKKKFVIDKFHPGFPEYVTPGWYHNWDDDTLYPGLNCFCSLIRMNNDSDGWISKVNDAYFMWTFDFKLCAIYCESDSIIISNILTDNGLAFWESHRDDVLYKYKMVYTWSTGTHLLAPSKKFKDVVKVILLAMQSIPFEIAGLILQQLAIIWF